MRGMRLPPSVHVDPRSVAHRRRGCRHRAPLATLGLVLTAAAGGVAAVGAVRARDRLGAAWPFASSRCAAARSRSPSCAWRPTSCWSRTWATAASSPVTCAAPPTSARGSRPSCGGRTAPAGRARMLVVPDMLPAEDFRRLRVMLRYARSGVARRRAGEPGLSVDQLPAVRLGLPGDEVQIQRHEHIRRRQRRAIFAGMRLPAQRRADRARNDRVDAQASDDSPTRRRARAPASRRRPWSPRSRPSRRAAARRGCRA